MGNSTILLHANKSIVILYKRKRNRTIYQHNGHSMENEKAVGNQVIISNT